MNYVSFNLNDEHFHKMRLFNYNPLDIPQDYFNELIVYELKYKILKWLEKNNIVYVYDSELGILNLEEGINAAKFKLKWM